MTEKTISRFFAWWQFVCPLLGFILVAAGFIGHIYIGTINIPGCFFYIPALCITGYLGRKAYLELREEYVPQGNNHK